MTTFQINLWFLGCWKEKNWKTW